MARNIQTFKEAIKAIGDGDKLFTPARLSGLEGEKEWKVLMNSSLNSEQINRDPESIQRLNEDTRLIQKVNSYGQYMNKAVEIILGLGYYLRNVVKYELEHVYFEDVEKVNRLVAILKSNIQQAFKNTGRFRKDIKSPEGFKLQDGSVMFMALNRSMKFIEISTDDIAKDPELIDLINPLPSPYELADVFLEVLRMLENQIDDVYNLISGADTKKEKIIDQKADSPSNTNHISQKEVIEKHLDCFSYVMNDEDYRRLIVLTESLVIEGKVPKVGKKFIRIDISNIFISRTFYNLQMELYSKKHMHWAEFIHAVFNQFTGDPKVTFTKFKTYHNNYETDKKKLKYK